LRNLMILLAVFVLLLIGRSYYRRNPQLAAQWLRKLLIGGGIAILVLLTLLGKLPWLIALVAAAIPVLFRFMPLLKYVPLLKRLYYRWQSKQAMGGAGNAQRSGVQSAYFDMTLDHASGEMDGEILQGRYQGRYLHQLSLQQLIALLGECSHDRDSAALLQAYLDRVHENWREQYQHKQQQSPSQTAGAMTREEALQILGVAADAGEKEIIEAHRRLMQKVHPDRGGSTYLAAKLNLAKELLLNS